jgi:bacteriorhodopsin|tara:strand:- start:1975 stop:2526 length:552 start_codon:yes stop_codon:yes gene_type:complete
MNIKNLRKEARRAILVDGITHTDFFKNCSDKYDLNQEKIAKEISHIPSKELIKKHKFARYLFVTVLYSTLILLMIGLSTMAKKLEVYLVVWSFLLFFVPVVIGRMAFSSHQRWQYYTCGAIMCVYALNGMYNQNAIFTIAVLIPAILSFYIPSLLKHKYEKKHITFNSDDGNDTETIEYLFEN